MQEKQVCLIRQTDDHSKSTVSLEIDTRTRDLTKSNQKLVQL